MTSNLKFIALIPARFAATRLPGKLMKVLDGKTIIRRTYEAVLESKLFDDVVVVCDHEDIEHEIKHIGGKVFRSTKQHESGTDRIAEAAHFFDGDVMINIQGDEPFIDVDSLKKLIQLFENKEVKIGSLMLKIFDIEKINNPNCVKVVVDKHNKAMYFSRASIPFFRAQNIAPFAFQHIGVYAFRKEVLFEITQLPVSELEHIEKLENLRMLENGIPIHMTEVKHVGISIDTQEDFEKATAFLQANL